MRTAEAIVESIIDGVIKREAGYVNRANDSGGPTNYGITQATARAYGYTGDMRDLPVSTARQIYRNRYVLDWAFDKVLAVNLDIGEELIDTGVNMGQGVAAVYFQRCLNVFNLGGSKYADVATDGKIGPVTIAAFKAFLAWREDQGRIVMLRALNSLQGANYVQLAEKRPKDEDFVYGWFANRVVI